jgi:hypothetical protein
MILRHATTKQIIGSPGHFDYLDKRNELLAEQMAAVIQQTHNHETTIAKVNMIRLQEMKDKALCQIVIEGLPEDMTPKDRAEWIHHMVREANQAPPKEVSCYRGKASIVSPSTICHIREHRKQSGRTQTLPRQQTRSPRQQKQQLPNHGSRPTNKRGEGENSVDEKLHGNTQKGIH